MLEDTAASIQICLHGRPSTHGTSSMLFVKHLVERCYLEIDSDGGIGPSDMYNEVLRRRVKMDVIMNMYR